MLNGINEFYGVNVIVFLCTPLLYIYLNHINLILNYLTYYILVYCQDVYFSKLLSFEVLMVALPMFATVTSSATP